MVDLTQLVAEEAEQDRREQERARLLDVALTAAEALDLAGKKRLVARVAAQIQEEIQPAQRLPRVIVRVAAPLPPPPRTLREAIERALANGQALGTGEITAAVQAMMPKARNDSVSSELWKMKKAELVRQGSAGPNGWPTYTLVADSVNGREVAR